MSRDRGRARAVGTPNERAEKAKTQEALEVSGEERKAARRDSGGARSDWLPTERISWFPIPDEDELDPRVADLVARQRQKLGAPNNVVRANAWRPDLMLKWLDLYEHISKGPSGLSRVEREMIGVVVSAENRCIF